MACPPISDQDRINVDALLRKAFNILNSAHRETSDGPGRGICLWHRLSPEQIAEAQCALLDAGHLVRGN